MEISLRVKTSQWMWGSIDAAAEVLLVHRWICTGILAGPWNRSASTLLILLINIGDEPKKDCWSLLKCNCLLPFTKQLLEGFLEGLKMRSVMRLQIPHIRYWNYWYRPLAHRGNAANLGGKTNEIFSSGNWDLIVVPSRLAAFSPTCKGSIVWTSGEIFSKNSQTHVVLY